MTSPTGLWTTVLKPGIWHFGQRHLSWIHPDPAFIQFIINGFKEGSHGGISTQSSISLECKKYSVSYKRPICSPITKPQRRFYHRSFTFLSFDQVTMTCLIAYTQSMMATKAHAIKIYCSGISLFSTFLMLLELYKPCSFCFLCPQNSPLQPFPSTHFLLYLSHFSADKIVFYLK